MEARVEVVLTKAELQLKVIYLISVWIEALLYGLYICLFLGALSVLMRKDVRKPVASKVFLLGNTLMFIAISFHSGLNIYRLVVAFAYQSDIRAPLLYLNDLNHWTALASPILLAILLWIGDALVIYRCFLIWQRKYWVIALPSLLYVVTIGIQLVNFWWICHQNAKVDIIVGRWPVLHVTFPMYLAQNVITTGLIIFKILSRERLTEVTGTVVLNTRSLVALMRVIVESAAIYTASILIMVILRALDHPGRLISHFILYPIIGIVFILMAIRVHAVQEETKEPPPPPSLMPSWRLGIRGRSAGATSTNEDHEETNSSSGDKHETSRIELDAMDSQHSMGEAQKESEIWEVKSERSKPSS